MSDKGIFYGVSIGPGDPELMTLKSVKCIEACEYDAVIRTSGKVPKLPNRLTKVGKFKR